MLSLAHRSDSRGQYNDTEALLRMLVEAEIDGVAVANQLTALKDSIDGLVKVKPSLKRDLVMEADK